MLRKIVLIAGFIGGCSMSEQPTEIEKSLIEKQAMECMIAVNTQRGIPKESSDWDFSGLESLTGALASMAELADDASNPLKNPTKKKWSVEGENENRKISMSFKLSDKSFQCDFLKRSAEWDLVEVRRNDEIVFNLTEDLAAKEENNRLFMELKAEKEKLKKEEEEKKIKQWTEKSYSNVSYKYYEKRHIDSRSSYSEPVLKVDCKPDDPLLVKYDHGGFSGKKAINLIITNINGEVDDSLKDIAVDQYGRMGLVVEKEYSFGINTDNSASLRLAALSSSISSIELDGFTFNFDDISQVPCLGN
tara:strand:- start:2187 stop:3098 length:912 start_codon:yes stop_codon:yes gene_type:complete